MGWFSSNSSTSIPPPSSQVIPPSQQIEQRSNQPLNLSPQTVNHNKNDIKSEDISHTLDQLSSNTSNPIQIKQLNSKSHKDANDSVTNFVNERPSNVFIIDGEKYSDESIICTNNGKGGKTCLKFNYNSIELFKQMQHLEYFCSLPNDIDATYFECRKIK